MVYKDLSQGEYEKALLGVGLPGEIAAMLANSDAGAAIGDLNSESTDLHTLIERATTPLVDAVRLDLERD